MGHTIQSAGTPRLRVIKCNWYAQYAHSRQCAAISRPPISARGATASQLSFCRYFISAIDSGEGLIFIS